GPDRAPEVDRVAEAVHVRELLVEVEPFLPAVEVGAALGAAPVVVAAARIRHRPRIALAPGERLENGWRPPVEVRIDDVHGISRRIRSLRYCNECTKRPLPGQRGTSCWICFGRMTDPFPSVNRMRLLVPRFRSS